VTLEVDVGGRPLVVDVSRIPGGYAVVVDGRRLVPDVVRIGDRWSILLEDRSYEIAITRSSGKTVAHVNGCPVPLTVVARRHRQGGERVARPHSDKGPRATTAPMPGKIVKVLVKAGDIVVARQGLVVIEAMKMENELRSVGAGRVTEIRVTEGMSVEAGTVLLFVE
jgi:biotin carboxyl carrier protein